MKRELGILTVFCLFGISNANALPLNIETHRVTATRAVQGCTDFSGDWKGTCTVTINNSSTKSDSHTTITQNGCNSFISDDQYFEIGGTKIESTSSSTRDSTNVTQLYWNADKSEVQVSAVSSARFEYNGEKFSSGFAQGKMALSGGQLLINLQGQGASPDGFAGLSCQYVQQH